MSEAPQVHRADAADGSQQTAERVLRWIPYVLLVASVLLSVLFTGLSGTDLVVGATVAAALLAWMWVLLPRPGRPARPAGWVLVYFVGFVAAVAVLLTLSPLFGFVAWVGYVHALLLPPRWIPVGVGATAVLTATSQAGGIPISPDVGLWAYVALVVVNLGVAGLVMFMAYASDRQSERRREMVAELAATNARLEATLTENAALHAELLVRAREAGVLDERQRMAREIHDTLAQGLTGIVTQLQAAQQAANGSADVRWHRHVETAARLARDSLDEARRSVQAIRPEPLDGARLPDALADVVDRWSTVTGVPVTVTTTGDARPMHPEVEVALLRTAQEALANTGRHASASRVGLTLSYMPDVVTLDVRDDGVGFRVGEQGAGGFGLVAMRQRVLRLAGALDVECEPGAGTAVCARVPAIPAEVSVG